MVTRSESWIIFSKLTLASMRSSFRFSTSHLNLEKVKVELE